MLRDGRITGSRAMAGVDVPWIVREHDRRGSKDYARTRATTRSAAEVFRAEEITLPRPGGGRAVDEVSLSLRAGEIVGIYGLMGAGRTELFEVHHGAAPACDGAVLSRRRAARGEGRRGADRARASR